MEKAPPPSRLLRIGQVLDLVPISRSNLWNLVKSGSFPAPRKLAPRTSAWSEAEVREWIESRPRANPTTRTASPAH